MSVLRIIFVGCFALSFADAAGVFVNIPGLGSIQGGADPNFKEVAFFGAIPYAKPPVGDLRWQIPQAHGPWGQKPLDGTKFGHECMQGSSATSAMSEDCLFLNVATPITAVNTSSKLPVMLWIHGGAYNTGSGKYPLTALVTSSKLSVIVVTINYRLNVFGFSGSAEIQNHTTDGSAGNFGIQDQRLAMSWVRDHIATFGGNGADITIFGESAGGNSVINHLAQKASFPMYQKAIVESGAYNRGATTLARAQTSYNNLLRVTGSKNLKALLALDAKTLLSKGGKRGAGGPVVDGVSLSATPWEIIVQGQHHKVPTIIGSNRDEMAFFAITGGTPKNLTEAQFDNMFSNRQDIKQLKKLYDPSVYPYPAKLGDYSQWWWMAMRIKTDYVPGCGACAVRNVARSLVKGGTPAVYTYLFAHPTQAPGPIPGQGRGSVVVPHAIEIPYVWGDQGSLTPGSEADLALSVSAYWYTFAKTGSPNPQGLPTWPKYDSQTDTVMRLDIPEAGGIHAQTKLRAAACDYQD